MLPTSIGKNGFMLFVFALVAAGILAVTHAATKDNIIASERRAAEKALLEIVPKERFDNDLLLDTLPIPETATTQLGDVAGEKIFIARKGERIIAVIIPAIAPDGYSGDIKFITGINADLSIAGVRVLAHRETPGLGDKIDIKKSQWITSFTGRSLDNTNSSGWKVKKDGGEFDQFSGATITPRALIKAIYHVLQYVDTHQLELFNKQTKAQAAIVKQRLGQLPTSNKLKRQPHERYRSD